MLVRLRQLLECHRQRGERFHVRIGGVDVTITEEPHPRDSSKTVRLATAVTSAEAPVHVVEFLTSDTPNKREYPSPVLDFGDEQLQPLGAAIREAVQLLRWRTGADMPHSPFSSLGVEWSPDGNAWFVVGGRAEVLAHLSPGLILTDEASAMVQELYASQAQEPLAHQLLREAKDVFPTNPRSGLVIGIAALETGFKGLVADLIPGAAWLMEHSPSPPLDKMFAHYLPSLPVRNALPNGAPRLPDDVRKAFRTAVEARNKVAHVGTGELHWLALDVLLAQVEDTLYLFDYFRGHGWALEHLSDHFRAALSIP